MASKDLYNLLGVNRDASGDDIKSSYRRLARKYHPDVNQGDKAAEEKFKEIGAAFEVLSDAKKRALYDELGDDAAKIGYDPEKAREYRAWRERAQRAGARGPSDLGGFDFEGGTGDFGDLGFDLGDIFGGVFSGRRNRRGPMRGQDVTAELHLPLRDAVLGGERDILIERQDGGSKRLKVKVPPGIDEGQVIRLAGQGTPGPQGGPAGDLLITAHIDPHPLLRREGNDLLYTLPVTIGEALLGATIGVPTLTGAVKLTVPPRSQTGTRLRLRGKGVPAPGGAPAGDLYVVLEVRAPVSPRDAARAERAARELDEEYGEDVRAGLRL